MAPKQSSRPAGLSSQPEAWADSNPLYRGHPISISGDSRNRLVLAGVHQFFSSMCENAKGGVAWAAYSLPDASGHGSEYLPMPPGNGLSHTLSEVDTPTTVESPCPLNAPSIAPSHSNCRKIETWDRPRTSDICLE